MSDLNISELDGLVEPGLDVGCDFGYDTFPVDVFGGEERNAQTLLDAEFEVAVFCFPIDDGHVVESIKADTHTG